MADTEGVPAPGNSASFSTDEVIIYGIKLNDGGPAKLNLSEGKWDVQISGSWSGTGTAPPFQIVAAYGYAFQGHCYRFDKPRILGFQGSDGQTGGLGCGFDYMGTPIPAGWYRMWRLRSKERLIELSATVDDVQAVVLDASLPGKRAPNTYRGDMQLAHRGGRLTST